MKNIFACICKLLLIQVVCYSEEEVFHYFLLTNMFRVAFTSHTENI